MKALSNPLLIILAIIILILMIFGFWYVISTVSAGGAIPWLLVIISAIAIATIVFALISQNKKKKMLAILTDGYRQRYDEVSHEILGSDLSSWEKKQVEEDLLALFYDAQTEGKSVNSVMGSDSGIFAKKIITAYGGRSSLWYYLLSGLQFFIIYMIFFKGLYIITGDAKLSEYFNLTVANITVFFFIFISFIIIPLAQYTIKQSMRSKRKGVFIISLIGINIALPIALAVFYISFSGLLKGDLAHLSWANTLAFGETPLFTSAWIGLLIIVIFVCSIFIKRLIKRKQIENDLL